jgi:hypothetical protein
MEGQIQSEKRSKITAEIQLHKAIQEAGGKISIDNNAIDTLLAFSTVLSDQYIARNLNSNTLSSSCS